MKYLHTAGTICTADRPLRRHMLCMHAHACMLVMADLMSRSGGAHGVHQPRVYRMCVLIRYIAECTVKDVNHGRRLF